jgi:hypothetical protein
MAILYHLKMAKTNQFSASSVSQYHTGKSRYPGGLAGSGFRFSTEWINEYEYCILNTQNRNKAMVEGKYLTLTWWHRRPRL